MRQGTEHTAPTSFSCTITCMIMLIIVNRIQFLYYSSYYKVFKVNNLFFFINNRPYCDGQQVPPASVRCIFL